MARRSGRRRSSALALQPPLSGDQGIANRIAPSAPEQGADVSARERKQEQPELKQLMTFLKVVEARSFAGAARIMGRTQPAISQAIARLEEIYGGDLFERRRGALLELTPIGQAILPSARTILDTLGQQMIRAAATAQSRAGNLTLGFSPGLLLGPLRGAIADFIAASPHVNLHFVEASPQELRRQLTERAIDLMIVAPTPRLESKTLVQEGLWDERLVTVLPADHALAEKTSVSWDDVAALSIILRNCHFELVAYRTLLDRLDRQIHLEQHEVSCTTLLEMIGLGMGATIVFASGAIPHRGVVYRPIDEPDATIAVEAVWPQDDRNPLRHRLLSLIREHKDDRKG